MKEIRFAGKPRIPTTQEFEDATKGNPLWAQVLSQGLKQFLDEDPARKETYGDPETGASLEQAWMTCTLMGTFPYCLLSTDQEQVATAAIKHVMPFSSKALVQLLRDYFKGAVEIKSLQTFYFDGTIGHCINLMAYNEQYDRFLYSDPWPLNSLLAAENNEAGIDAQHVAGKRWSITGAELEKVIFACFMFPSEWYKFQQQPVFWNYADWQKGQFYTFFHLNEIERVKDVYDVNGKEYYRLILQTGGFQGMNTISLNTSLDGEISSGTLLTNREWINSHYPFALDIFKSFLGSFFPIPEHQQYQEMVEKIWQYQNTALIEALVDKQDKADQTEALMQTFLGVRETYGIASEFSTINVRNVPYKDTAFFELEIICI